MKKLALVLALAVAVNCVAQSAGHSATAKAPQKYGAVHFAVSCTPAAQKQFDVAVAMLHSFFYPETVGAFNKVVELDPACAMAYWGVAISQRPNPLVGPFAPDALKRGMEAIAKARSLNAKTQREKDWIEALAPFFTDYGTLDQKTRTGRYTEAMQRLYERYPQDTEAAVFYALALNENADLGDKTHASQIKAAAILEKVRARHPGHPGVVHYLIHSYDYQPLAGKGMTAANSYAAIAPSAPHALHMPSHIYSMTGQWTKSIKANQSAFAAGAAYAAAHYPENSDPTQFHCLDFMEYAWLQLGQDQKAKAVADQLAALKPVKFERIAVDTAAAAIPARYALERGAWAEAASLPVRKSAYPYAEAITYFARALGAARTDDLPRAKESVEKLQALHASYAEKPDEAYWAKQTEVLLQGALSAVARAEGRFDDALRLMRAAADLEDASEKHVAMENRLFPMREQLGYMLLEMNKPALARVEFATAMKAMPNRLRGVFGAARAAQLTGDLPAARVLYLKLLTLTRGAGANRPEIALAKAFFEKKKKGNDND